MWSKLSETYFTFFHVEIRFHCSLYLRKAEKESVQVSEVAPSRRSIDSLIVVNTWTIVSLSAMILHSSVHRLRISCVSKNVSSASPPPRGQVTPGHSPSKHMVL